MSQVTDSSGTYVLATTTAGMSAAFSSLSFGYSGDPLAQPGVALNAKTAGVRTLPRNATVGINLSHTFSLPDGIVSGQVNLDADLSISAEVNTSFGIPNGISLASSATVTATAGLDATLSGSHTWTLGELDFTPFDIQAGPVPIFLVPKVLVTLTASGSISVGVEASMRVGAALSWSSRNSGVLHTQNLTTGPHMDGSGPLPGVSASASGDIDFQVQPQIGIYDVAGPNIEADADLSANVNFLGSPYFTLTPSVSLGAGLDFDIAGGLLHGSLDVTIGTFEFPGFAIQNAPNATLAISPSRPTVIPGTPMTFTSTRSDGKTDPVTWRLIGAVNGDSISSAGVLSAVNPTGRSLTVQAQDSTGAVGQTTVSVGASFDPVANLEASQDSNSLDVTVSWSPPDVTGNSPIDSYTVTGSDGVPSQSTTNTSVDLSGLHPGITYVIAVYPVNSGGQTGPSATTTIEVLPLCTDTFTGGTQGSGTAWNNASNWSGSYVPGPGDWVCINSPGAVLSKSTSVEGLQMNGDMTIDKGATLTVSNTLLLNNELSGPGTITVAGGAQGTLGPTSGLAGGARFVNDGTTLVQMGESGGCYGEEGFFDGSVLENAGVLQLVDNATLGECGDDNSSNAVVNDPGSTISYDGSTSAASAMISLPVQDSGTLQVQQGTLDVSTIVPVGNPSISGSGSTIVGAVNVSGAQSLSGTWSLTGDVTGPGSLTLTAGSQVAFGYASGLYGGVRVVNQGEVQIQMGDQGGCYGGEGSSGGSVLENAGIVALTTMQISEHVTTGMRATNSSMTRGDHLLQRFVAFGVIHHRSAGPGRGFCQRRAGDAGRSGGGGNRLTLVLRGWNCRSDRISHASARNIDERAQSNW